MGVVPTIAMLAAAMVQARDAVDRRSWSHPREPTSEAWWADVLADPRAQPGDAIGRPLAGDQCEKLGQRQG
jgi:hypothetical protein